MPDQAWFQREAEVSLRRLMPRLEARYAHQLDAPTWQTFTQRLEAHYPRLFELLCTIYQTRYDLLYHLERTLEVAAETWLARPADLRALDAERERNPHWFQSNRMLGGVCYVDLFAGDLHGVHEKIPYFKELGLTYLHLMPLFQCPEGKNDGGYAVSSYREVNPALGAIRELRALAAELREHGISLCVDFIFNPTSDEHEWAQRALAGDPDYRDFYFIFPNREMPDAYERNLREIFPDEHSGAFTPLTPYPLSQRERGISSEETHPSPAGRGAGGEGQSWVWTTFHEFQWDLNYANPAVFTAMTGEMLFLANVGVEVLRMDAVAFIWKQLGTVCENLPEAHLLIQAFNAVCRIAAPSLLFKSEAIVHPDDVAKYIRPDECQLSYNPLLMALLWNSLATRKVRLLSHSMRHRFAIHSQTAWVNYVRVHDDIGWTFSDEDAQQLGMKGYDHRQFLNQFYTGRFAGSFARGLPFQEDPKTGDCRISGTCASLAGLEKALAEETEREVELALNRILLIHGLILSIGGIPLIYLGDEIGTVNDYRYRDDHAKAEDSRWVHRPVADWEKYARRNDATTVEGRLYKRMRQLITLRQQHGIFAGGQTEILETASPHVFAFARTREGQRLVELSNFSEATQDVSTQWLGLLVGATATDLITGAGHRIGSTLSLQPYQLMWLIA
ncbi:MAG: amylosucrase [Anaerolineales bacterium]